jgi:c-di-GMP-related signal transduction protein
MDVFVARQPIFNRDHHVIGYELLYRDSEHNAFNPIVASDIATVILLMNSYLHFGIDHLIGESTAFINFDSRLIAADAPQLLSNKNVVIEVLEDVKATPLILEKLKNLRDDGYTLAIDDFEVSYPHKDIIELAHIIKVDFLNNSRDEIKSICKRFMRQGKTLLAEKVETREEYEWAKKIGFDYFQGFFFAKPDMVKSKSLNESSAQYIRLYNALHEPEPDYKKITKIIEIDVVLTYKLLRLVNSSFSLGAQINSVHHALSILGSNAFCKWLTLASFQKMGQGKASELVKIALIRSKLLETMGKKGNILAGYEEELALMGILSVLDVMLQEPMCDVIKRLPLSESIKQTFLGKENILYYPFQLTLLYERGEFSRIEEYSNMFQYKVTNLSKDYIEAVEWAEDLYRYMNELTLDEKTF